MDGNPHTYIVFLQNIQPLGKVLPSGGQRLLLRSDAGGDWEHPGDDDDFYDDDDDDDESEMASRLPTRL